MFDTGLREECDTCLRSITYKLSGLLLHVAPVMFTRSFNLPTIELAEGLHGAAILSISLAVTVFIEFANAFFKVLVLPYLSPEFLGHHFSGLPNLFFSIQN